jgi:zinc/manganese transport system substrate-binding protein
VSPRFAVAAATITLAAVLAGCGSDDTDSGVDVVATTGVLADITRHVAGPDAEVAQLIPDGSDPHSFSLSAHDRLRLDEADLVVANGAGLEAGIPVDEGDAPTYYLAEHAGELRPAGDGDDSGALDPHVWMDPTRVAAALPSLAAALGDADPAHAAAYEHRAADYSRALRSLDRELGATLESVPADKRELVTSHDALEYFAARYGFEVAATAFPVTGTEAEASATRLADAETAVRETGVATIFAELGDDPEALRTVADDTGVEIDYDLMVESLGPSGSYAEMLRSDAQQIADGLGE